MTSQSRDEKLLPSTTLGKRRETPYTYTPELLEAIPFSLRRDFTGQSSLVSLRCERFTSLCPVTGQPDWASLTLTFLPKAHLVESKALKEYLNSFRMHGDFHEDVCRIIADDLVRCVAPRYLEVVGTFDSRGSIAIWPFVQYAAAGDAEAQTLLQTRRAHYAPGKYA